ncbi:alanine racemase [Thioalkalivibrio sp. HK1]|uniref:alanine racemase n=1 Tax=Thioalkalivibrio sp. HK1 TaxID=1469245 RepID=UPI000470FB77|nr:alanine racemase [Thioalkalivibrio sp. HK1]
MKFPSGSSSPARLIVDLAALGENYRTIRTLAEGGSGPSEVAAVVKADAYGLGMPAVARALFSAGCRTFFTAFSHEGIALRQVLGDDSEIFVLIPTFGLGDMDSLGGATDAPAATPDPASEIEAMRRFRLIPCLFDLAGIDRWIESTRPAKAPAALHVETGINRLGLAPKDLERLLQDRSRLARLDIVLLMSHLACADDPADPANDEQRRRFCAILRDFPGIRTSLANSAGGFLGSEYHFDLLRPGIALYGHDPHDLAPHDSQAPSSRMRPVATLQARLGQVRELAAGERIGYGGKARCHGPRRVGVVLAGYADGIPRSLYGPRGAAEASIDGHRAPFFGTVSMDMTTIDLTHLPESSVRPGAWVELFGTDPSITEVAQRAGTIPYEILTGIGPRVERIYIQAPDRPASFEKAR